MAIDADWCDVRCSRIVLSCCVAAVFVASLLAVLLWRAIVAHKRKSTSSRSGLSAEYAFTTPLTVEYMAPTSWTEAAQALISPLQIDERWEVDRSTVCLESTLGEGEFGRVVKATVVNLHGADGTTTVAIKMLKESASVSEYRDLISEFNLLKDVNHRNVIKLLGVCSRDGPLYLIVEFCEHGSLRSYLRGTRHQATGEQSHVSAQTLLSFAWQIANGMDYLTDMKVVHRDLAARNVLLATGMVAKVSDFGLSRDIYEDDAYLKTTKGPLPVKWMAPESLFDQIYTTKSDVWSYGVVLWEIVTLGANPYPGISAESLYQMLKTGYRMEKPAFCSDQLYGAMMSCWQINPADRPSFKELSTSMETFLVQTAEYLDLDDTVDAPNVDSSAENGSPGPKYEPHDAGDAFKTQPVPVVTSSHMTNGRSQFITSDIPVRITRHQVSPAVAESSPRDSQSKLRQLNAVTETVADDVLLNSFHL